MKRATFSAALALCAVGCIGVIGEPIPVPTPASNPTAQPDAATSLPDASTSLPDASTPEVFTLLPAQAQVPTLGRLSFSVTPSTAVTWSSDCGTVVSDGLFTAPASPACTARACMSMETRRAGNAQG